jgi:NAD(P)H-dependent flavin oxidoreductase YrpB (nitropropane dioxygenase family)
MSFLHFKGKHLDIPIIQGGMGIGVSLGNLAGHVMKEGGMGVISAAQPGYRDPDFRRDPFTANIKALKVEIKKAREIAQGKGLLGVNIMVAAQQYDRYASEIGMLDIDVIISGAGLPLELPNLIKNEDIALAPIVSSGKAAYLLCRRWFQRYLRYPDFIIIEGPLAGGHLGFSWDELKAHSEQTLESIFEDCKKALEDLGQNIPLVVAGGIYTGTDIADFLKKGAAAVQMATRFIATFECDAHENFKQMFLSAKKEDIDFVISPSGYPGRAIVNEFVTLMRTQRIPPIQCVNCLRPCKPATTPYCITEALINAVSGDVDHGLVFTGTNGYRIDKIVSVHALIDELVNEMKAVMV